MDYYTLLKWLHILSATVLFGTGIGTAFQMVAAMGSRDVRVIAAVSRNVVLADWIFTTPAVLVQPATGIALVYMNGWSPGEPWLLVVYALYLLALSCWLPVVWLQKRIATLSGTAARNNQPLPAICHRYFRIWFTLGWPAFIAFVTVFWLMITKPPLWETGL